MSPLIPYDRVLDDDAILGYGDDAAVDKVTASPIVVAQAASPNKPANPKQPVDLQKKADEMVQELIPIFKKKFSRNKTTLGPNIGKTVPVVLVSDADMDAALTTQARDTAKHLLNARLKFAPDKVRETLKKYYQLLGEPFPYADKVIDENTKLTAEEKTHINGLDEAFLIVGLREDAKRTQGFYARPFNGNRIGKIFIRKEIADLGDFTHVLAGVLAHEMAHAYAEITWYDFLDAMFARGMSDTGFLNEGMTTRIEKIVTTEWHNQQPSGTLIPLAGYRNEPKVGKREKSFVNAVGAAQAHDAYFGGWVEFINPNKPEDTIKVGKSNKKSWKWPWR
ncbi:MAG: hypothetical protein DHS20C20_24530 [Ardenticatenaceae bacterium]|nr:MAG: hypothetical protein DHS20C20_24530 [Ardenticatenaceae bacterium]